MNIPLTIIAGVAVFAASQYVLKLIVEPIVELKKTIASISNALLYHQAVITNAHPNEDVSSSLRQLSADLRSNASAIPFYRVLWFIHIFRIPKKESILKACHSLNGLSYRMNPEIENDDGKGKVVSENVRALDEISQLLNIETTYREDP